jgi:hypothetical protein
MSTPLSYAVAMPRGAEPGRLLDVRLVFFATVYALVSVATFCMWLGEDEAFPYPWLVLSAALAALVLTDGRQLLAIPPVLTGWLALGVLALFAWEELREWQFDPVMPLGHLLIYLELSFFFHRKKAWYLWAMVFMSFLQVVIAALHSNKLLFGRCAGAATCGGFQPIPALGRRHPRHRRRALPVHPAARSGALDAVADRAGHAPVGLRRADPARAARPDPRERR